MLFHAFIHFPMMMSSAEFRFVFFNSTLPFSRSEVARTPRQLLIVPISRFVHPVTLLLRRSPQQAFFPRLVSFWPITAGPCVMFLKIYARILLPSAGASRLDFLALWSFGMRFSTPLGRIFAFSKDFLHVKVPPFFFHTSVGPLTSLFLGTDFFSP